MPVVNLPAQRSHSVINPSHISLGQAPFLLTLAAALVGPIALLTLVVSFTRNYKSSSCSVLAEVRAATATEEPLWLPKQSREINARRSIMPISRKPEISPIRDHRALEEEGTGSRHALSQSPSGRKIRQDEPDAVKADTCESRDLKARSSPPAPVTPPALSAKLFSFQNRRLSIAASSNGEFDPSYTHRLKSDSHSSPSSGSTTIAVSSTQTSSPISLQRSYTKLPAHDPFQPSLSTEAVMGDDLSTFSPSSFPSSSPILPLAPHASLESGEIDVTSGIIPVMDHSGADWKRHTRVYGGGVCLACMASGDHDGGFYGDNVPLDQRR
ncbi:hypothetical protein F5Y19DRAFT_68951 [Xylariaceae sp. FL1651]|nr:hypothetical protein F5Y19DRAFT_68951 [Xylariaceae sp. FL1651]